MVTKGQIELKLRQLIVKLFLKRFHMSYEGCSAYEIQAHAA